MKIYHGTLQGIVAVYHTNRNRAQYQLDPKLCHIKVTNVESGILDTEDEFVSLPLYSIRLLCELSVLLVNSFVKDLIFVSHLNITACNISNKYFY